jgi:large subunit ribosomal protein L21
MYAIIEDGSRQYRAEHGKTLTIDHRDGVAVGDVLELNKVLLLSNGDGTTKIGRPLVAGASVKAEVIGFPRVKTMTQKFRRRKASKRLKGHTQPHVRVKITGIAG